MTTLATGESAYCDAIALAMGHGAAFHVPFNEAIPPENHFSIHLPKTSKWIIRLEWLKGIQRSGSGDVPFEIDDKTGEGTVNDVDLPELNRVRNEFGKSGPIGVPGWPGDVTWDNVEDLNTVRNMFGAPDWHSWDGATHRTGLNPEDVDFRTMAVPEPSTLTMLALGLFGLSTRQG